MAITGSCKCGNVTVTVASEHPNQIICHCNDCKKFGAAPFSTNILPQSKDVTITGETKKTTTKSNSGNEVTWTNCANCGTPITHYSPVFGEGIIVQTGIFESFKDVPVGAELFASRRWSFLSPIEGAAQFPEMMG